MMVFIPRRPSCPHEDLSFWQSNDVISETPSCLINKRPANTRSPSFLLSFLFQYLINLRTGFCFNSILINSDGGIFILFQEINQ
jgi:hypothetical protein